MRIAIVGAGGVGGYFGARLAAAGADVTFIARGAHLAAMRRQGLTITSALGDLTVSSVRATDDPASIGPVDYVIVAVKLYDSDAAAEVAKTLAGPRTAAVSVQNGVTGAESLVNAMGAERVFGGVAYIMAVIDKPGHIAHTGTMARLAFGELDGRASMRVESLVSALRKADVEVEASSDIRTTIWSKFALLAPLSGITALTRSPIGPIRTEAATRALYRAALDEVLAVAAAENVALPTGTAEKTMARIDQLPAEMGSSMLYDLLAGRRLELPWLSGAVARLGRVHGVPTPTHDFVVAALTLHASGTRRPESTAAAYSPR